MRVGTILAALLASAGCTTYGRPPAHTPVARSSKPSCSVSIRAPADTDGPRSVLEGERARQLTADLEATGWFRAVTLAPSDTKSAADFVLELVPSPVTYNDPFLSVVTLGLAPNPRREWHGYRFRLYSRDSRGYARVVDTTYSTTDWFGVLVPLLTLSPGQTLQRPTEQYVSYFARLLQDQAPELTQSCGG